MDVSRISAITPKQIDWRALTAKEIIKYENIGVTVPSQYLQWAMEFRASLETNDETTYEMALNKKSSKTPETSNTTVSTSTLTTDTTDTTSTTNTTSTTDTTGTTQETKSAAQTKREEMQLAGINLKNQALSFTKDSKDDSKAVLESASKIEDAESRSVDEIASLQNMMEELLSKAESTQNELKGEVANINNDKSDKNTFSKIDKLQKQLQQYGATGQMEVAFSEGDFNQYEAIIAGQIPEISTAKDFGSETVSVGNDFMKTISLSPLFFDWEEFMIATEAISSGKKAQSDSEATQTLQTDALALNSANLSAALPYKAQIQDKTGVEAINTNNNKNDTSSSDAKTPDSKPSKDSAQNNADGTKKESEKQVKTSQNDGTDTTDKAHTNIDEILKRKIRKGEDTTSA